MSEQVKVNDPILIAAHLEDSVVGKFLRATVTNEDGIEIGGSPVALADLGGGIYRDKSLIKKRGTFFAIIEVFDNAGFTESNQDFEEGVLTFTDPPFNLLFNGPIDVDITPPEPLEIDIAVEPLEINIADPTVINIDIDCD